MRATTAGGNPAWRSNAIALRVLELAVVRGGEDEVSGVVERGEQRCARADALARIGAAKELVDHHEQTFVARTRREHRLGGFELGPNCGSVFERRPSGGSPSRS